MSKPRSESGRWMLARDAALFGLGGFLIVDFAIGGYGREIELVAGLLLVGVVPLDAFLNRGGGNSEKRPNGGTGKAGE